MNEADMYNALALQEAAQKEIKAKTKPRLEIVSVENGFFVTLGSTYNGSLLGGISPNKTLIATSITDVCQIVTDALRNGEAVN